MKPILFSPPMVKAILEGRKTMTRRMLKTQPVFENETDQNINEFLFNEAKAETNGSNWPVKCPYGNVGDILWVKEAFYGWGHWETIGVTKTGKVKFKFIYDSKEVCFEEPDYLFRGKYSDLNYLDSRWYKRNSLFMPFWASRIQLEITKVRCERVQDITEEDAKNEGVSLDCPIGHIPSYQKSPYVYSFAYLWDTINGYGSFEKNPWVWVLEFRRVK